MIALEISSCSNRVSRNTHMLSNITMLHIDCEMLPEHFPSKRVLILKIQTIVLFSWSIFYVRNVALGEPSKWQRQDEHVYIMAQTNNSKIIMHMSATHTSLYTHSITMGACFKDTKSMSTKEGCQLSYMYIIIV